MALHKILILPNVAGAPALVGVYHLEGALLEAHSLEIPLSDGLVPLFMQFQARDLTFEELYFARGPGSFMALKLVYLFAKTLEIAQGVRLYATDSFCFNDNAPIKAYGNCYFVKEILGDLEQITLKTYAEIPLIKPLILPKILDSKHFCNALEPLYILPPL